MGHASRVATFYVQLIFSYNSCKISLALQNFYDLQVHELYVLVIVIFHCVTFISSIISNQHCVLQRLQYKYRLSYKDIVRSTIVSNFRLTFRTVDFLNINGREPPLEHLVHHVLPWTAANSYVARRRREIVSCANPTIDLREPTKIHQPTIHKGQ